MYDIALFFHIVGVVALVLALGYGLGGLFAAQRARDVGGVRAALSFVPVTERLIPPAMLLILAMGLYMVSQGGDGGGIDWSSGWVDTAIAVFALMSVLGPAVESKRVGRLRERAAELADGPVPPELDALRFDPILTHVACFGALQVVAFLFLMTNKPSLGASIAICVGAGALSAVVARLVLRSAEAHSRVVAPSVGIAGDRASVRAEAIGLETVE